MSARVLILTAGFGEGHSAAAHALALACEAAGGPGTARTLDVFALAAPRWNRLLRGTYLALINRAPRLWRGAYRWLDRSPATPRLAALLRRETRSLDRILAREQPKVIASTYPLYGFMIERLRSRAPAVAPLFTVVTDSISIHSLWWRAPADGWFVPNDDSAEVLRDAGVPGSRVQVLGFPVTPRLAELRDRLEPPPLDRGAAPRVLYILNSRRPAAIATARRLLADTNWEITCAVGRNEQLRRELAERAETRRHPTRILGWTDEIPRLLLTHHVVISKAGGATTQEALAARCPMLMNQIVPGQEEGNYELLRRHGVGTLADTPERVIAALEQAFAGGGAVWARWRRNLEPLSRPRAAHDIADRLLLAGAASAPGRPAGATQPRDAGSP